MSELQNAVETQGLTKIFKDFWGRPKVAALRDFDLSVKPGSIVGLLGPNGSGKTTTIRLLLGLLHPTRGRAQVLGHSPQHTRIKQRIGYLPEETYLYPYLNAEETLRFFGALFNLSNAQLQARVRSLIEMVGLEQDRKRPLREYSKGMARRIGLAQALINDPEVLILDEPTSGLDPIGAREIKDFILEFKRRGKTVLLTGHLLSDMEAVCDEISLLIGGKLRLAGPVSDLLARRDRVNIQTSVLDEGTLAEIREVIRRRQPDADVAVDHPRQSLEELFLHEVEKANLEKNRAAPSPAPAPASGESPGA